MEVADMYLCRNWERQEDGIYSVGESMERGMNRSAGVKGYIW